MLVHVGRTAPGGAALVKISTGGFVVEEGRPHACARIGAAHHGAQGTGVDAIARYRAGKIQAAGAAARHAPADHATHVLACERLVAIAGQADGAGGIGIGDGAAVASDQAADIRAAAHATGGVGLRNGAVIIADQATDLFAWAGDGATGARHADAAVAIVGTDQAANR